MAIDGLGRPCFIPTDGNASDTNQTLAMLSGFNTH